MGNSDCYTMGQLTQGWIIFTLLTLSVAWAEPQPGGDHHDKTTTTITTAKSGGAGTTNGSSKVTTTKSVGTGAPSVAVSSTKKSDKTTTTTELSRDSGTGTPNIPSFHILMGG